jgi:hypothetical protein
MKPTFSAPAPHKPVLSIPAFQRGPAPWGKTKTYDLINSGVLETVRIGGRQYIVMASFNRLATPAQVAEADQ